MKYIITESQKRRLLNEQVITKDGFVKVTDKTKIGILNPLGQITLVPSGTTINKLNTLSDKRDDYAYFREWKGGAYEGWIPNIDQFHTMEGTNLGKGPTVGCFKEPDGISYCATYHNIYWVDAYDKPRPDGWRFIGYTANKKKTPHKGGSYHPDKVIPKRPKEATGKTVLQKFDDIDDLNIV